MTDFDNISHYLKIKNNFVFQKKITLYQNTYMKTVFNYYNMQNKKPARLCINLVNINFLQSFNIIIDLKTI